MCSLHLHVFRSIRLNTIRCHWRVEGVEQSVAYVSLRSSPSLVFYIEKTGQKAFYQLGSRLQTQIVLLCELRKKIVSSFSYHFCGRAQKQSKYYSVEINKKNMYSEY